MNIFSDFIAGIDDNDQRNRMEDVLMWVMKEFPDLQPVVKWNQPMFTHKETYIIGFSVSKKHLAFAPERAGIIKFEQEFEKSGYEYSQQLVRIPWEKTVDYNLLQTVISFNIQDKAGYTGFWRKA